MFRKLRKLWYRYRGGVPVRLTPLEMIRTEELLVRGLEQLAIVTQGHPPAKEKAEELAKEARQVAAVVGRLGAARTAACDCEGCDTVRAEARVKGITVTELLTPTISTVSPPPEGATPKTPQMFLLPPGYGGLSWN